MFKNPLKKYQQGGAAPTQEEQQVLAAFIEWLPKRVKEFEGMQPEAIAQALDGMTKTPEGQKQVQQLMEQFQQEMQSAQAFRQGGKIHDFICKHSKGGHVAGCGCKENGGSVEKAQEGLPKIGGTFKSADGQITIRNFGTADADTLGTYSYPTTNGEFRFNKNGRTATVWDNTGGWADHFYADPNWIRRHPRRQLLPKGLGGSKEVAPEGFFENLVQRVNNRIPQQQEGGKVAKGQWGLSIIHPEAVKRAYDKVDAFLNPVEGEYIGGLGPLTYINPAGVEEMLYRIPTQATKQSEIASKIIAASKKQQAIDAATKAGKIYIDTPVDLDIDKLPNFNKFIEHPDFSKITITENWWDRNKANAIKGAIGAIGGGLFGAAKAKKKNEQEKSE